MSELLHMINTTCKISHPPPAVVMKMFRVIKTKILDNQIHFSFLFWFLMVHPVKCLTYISMLHPVYKIYFYMSMCVGGTMGDLQF